MIPEFSLPELEATGLDGETADKVLKKINHRLSSGTSAEQWQETYQTILTPEIPFALHKLLYERIYAEWDHRKGPPPAWFPTEQEMRSTHLYELMQELGFGSYDALFVWSVDKRPDFWRRMIDRLGIRFDQERAGWSTPA